MGSRDNVTPHQPLLSSLVVRPTDSGGAGSDYEPGEVRRDPPPYSRSGRYSDDPGYRSRSDSGSPVRRREFDRRYSPEVDHFDGPPRPRGFGGGRENIRSPGRYRDYSPPYHHSRGRGGGRHFGRGFGAPGYGRGAGRGPSLYKSNVQPREGDWYCSDPMCGNLNFARREYCNNCKRHRYAPAESPRRGYGGPPPQLGPPRRFPGPPMDRSHGRFVNGYRSPPPPPLPPRAWARDFGPGGPSPVRHEGRYGGGHSVRRDRLDYPEDDFRDHRGKFDRPPPTDWSPRDRRDDFVDRKGFDGRPLSPVPAPPPPAGRGRWSGRDMRERSRSPIRGGPPPKEFRRDPYMGRGRDDRRGVGRDRVGNVY